MGDRHGPGSREGCLALKAADPIALQQACDAGGQLFGNCKAVIVSEEDLGMMLFGILPQEFHSGKIALLIIDHAGKLRHRLIVARE